MRVEWSDNDTKYRGEVISAIHAWGKTKLVVMTDEGEVREVSIALVKRVGHAHP